MVLKNRRVDVLDIKHDVKNGLLEFYVKDGKIYAAEILRGTVGSICVDGEHGDTMIVGYVADQQLTEWPNNKTQIRFVGQSSALDEHGTLIITDDYEQVEADGTVKRWSTIREVEGGRIQGNFCNE